MTVALLKAGRLLVDSGESRGETISSGAYTFWEFLGFGIRFSCGMVFIVPREWLGTLAYSCAVPVLIRFQTDVDFPPYFLEGKRLAPAFGSMTFLKQTKRAVST